MNEHALGHNFLAGCFLMCCVPLYPNIVQRQAVAKKSGIASNCVEDVLLSCCCGLCVLAQSANQLGEAADISCATHLLVDCLRLCWDPDAISCVLCDTAATSRWST